MSTTKIIKYKFFNAALAFSSLVLANPNAGISMPSEESALYQSHPSNFDFIISDLFHQAEIGNIQGVQLQLQNIAEMIEKSDDALTDSCIFLEDLVNKMNNHFGTTLTLTKILQQTRDTIYQFGIPEEQSEKYMVGFDLIDHHRSTLNEGYVRLARHHKRSNFWTWLTVATVTVAAVTVCIVVPQVAPAVIGGAVEVGKAALGK